MIEYKYPKSIFIAYLTFLPVSLVVFGFVLMILMQLVLSKWLIMVLLLMIWFILQLYLMLRVLRSKIVISAESLVILNAFTSAEIPYQRVVAYRSYTITRNHFDFLNPFFFVTPSSTEQQWVEIFYKDYKGKNRVLRKDLSFFKNYKELLSNLDRYLLKK